MKIALLETTHGLIALKFYAKYAPQAVFNFMQLVQSGAYDGNTFHRVIPNFMIQAGGIEGKLSSSVYGKPFKDEVTHMINFARPGVLAMANCGKDTNGSQFFITTAPTEWLNMHHTIFGEVFLGYDVAVKIAYAKKDKSDKPLVDQKIIKAYMKNIDEKSFEEYISKRREK